MGPLEDTVSKRKLVYVPAIVPTLHHIEPALLGSSYFTDLILVVIRFDSLNWKRLTFSCQPGISVYGNYGKWTVSISLSTEAEENGNDSTTTTEKDHPTTRGQGQWGHKVMMIWSGCIKWQCHSPEAHQIVCKQRGQLNAKVVDWQTTRHFDYILTCSYVEDQEGSFQLPSQSSNESEVAISLADSEVERWSFLKA